MIYELPEKLIATNSFKIEQEILEAIATCDDCFIIDMSHTEYISSSCLRVFLLAKRTLAAKGIDFKIININDFCKKIITITGFDSLFTIE